MDETQQPTIAETVPAGTPPPDAAHDEHTAHDVAKHIRLYLMVGATLLTFTAITVFLSYVNFGTMKANVAVAMAVATFKAALVAAIFMHLSHERKWIYGSLLLTVLFFIVLMTIPIFTMMDAIGTPIQAPAAEHAKH